MKGKVTYCIVAGRRFKNHPVEEEPEWFTAGPTSQHDTIELKGFNNPEKGDPSNRDDERNRRAGTARNEKVLERPRKKGMYLQ